ncbi:MAG: C40 family peptidase [Lentisphaeria bacterium]|nr:C40 family peptidase [Candidatus Neomarinimicrobiota bacterium]MCF7842700.1 C40 family peptidase [Lentisphaeria bacterium]
MSEKSMTNIGVANIYEEPAFRSQVVSQSYLGESLHVLSIEKDWFRVRQEDGYEGWINAGQAVEKPADWDDVVKFTTDDLVTTIYDQPDMYAAPLRDMILGTQLPLRSRRDGWVEISLPDGITGWVVDHPYHYPSEPTVEQLLSTAMRFQGIPYFWGGKTPKGFDCSGFVQTVFRLNGQALPRDAWQQAEVGETLPANWETWQAGDLIFFSENGQRITHVALSLGAGDYIHASGYVKLNSFNSNHGELYHQPLVDNYVKTQRVIAV